ncbi:MAG: hypothetical protein KBA53_07350 [Thermoclostridium sp.]|nr:hypothetical protein [Thermoclostridium sp.]
MGNTVTWGDLIKIVLFLLGAGALFYLILAMANLVGILQNLNRMLTKNRASIDSTLDKLPEITENVAKVTDIVKDEMESIQKVMGNIGKISDTAKDAAEMIKKDIVVKAKNLLDIIDWIRNIFQDKNKRKKEIVYKYKYKPVSETVEEEVSSYDHSNDSHNNNEAGSIKEDEQDGSSEE